MLNNVFAPPDAYSSLHCDMMRTNRIFGVHLSPNYANAW